MLNTRDAPTPIFCDCIGALIFEYPPILSPDTCVDYRILLELIKVRSNTCFMVKLKVYGQREFFGFFVDVCADMDSFLCKPLKGFVKSIFKIQDMAEDTVPSLMLTQLTLLLYRSLYHVIKCVILILVPNTLICRHYQNVLVRYTQLYCSVLNLYVTV